MKVELTSDEIKGILWAVQRSDVKEIIYKLNLGLSKEAKGLYSAEFKLDKLITKLNKEEII